MTDEMKSTEPGAGWGARAAKDLSIRVVNHWFNDSGDAEIVLVEPVVQGIELRNDLFWFADDQMPRWSPGVELVGEQIQGRECYRWGTFTSIEHDIPDGFHMPL